MQLEEVKKMLADYKIDDLRESWCPDETTLNKEKLD